MILNLGVVASTCLMGDFNANLLNLDCEIQFVCVYHENVIFLDILLNKFESKKFH